MPRKSLFKLLNRPEVSKFLLKGANDKHVVGQQSILYSKSWPLCSEMLTLGNKKPKRSFPDGLNPGGEAWDRREWVCLYMPGVSTHALTHTHNPSCTDTHPVTHTVVAEKPDQSLIYCDYKWEKRYF